MTEELYVLPASFGQRRLWLAEQAQPDNPLYTMSIALRLRGPLDLTALGQAFTDVTERHEVLRTVLRLTGSQVSQVIRAAAPVSVEVIEAGDEQTARREAERLAAVPFDLANGPLLRCHALRIAADDHLLLVVVHHTVMDGESVAVLWGEVAVHYAARLKGTTADLPELPLQYADFAVWQEEQLAAGTYEPQVEYWRKELAGAEELRLPTNRPRRAAATYASAAEPVTIPAPVVRQLRATAVGGVTASMVALAGFAVVLSRWSGQTDLTVALPVGGRSETDLEELVGFFVNTVPVRLDLSGDPSFADLLTQVRDRSVGAYSNPDVPFELLVERLNPRRLAGRTPLAQAMLAAQPDVLGAAASLPGVETTLVNLPQERLVFDVDLSLTGRGDALTGLFSGRTELFDAEVIAVAARSVEAVLRAAAAAPATPLSRLTCPVADLEITPAEEPVETATEPVAVLPATETEHLLLALWREVLENPALGLHDEFYASGGNSMRAVRIITRARDSGVELPVEVVFGEHTVRDLTTAL